MPHEHPSYQFDCDAVLFDLDGVLVNSRQCVERHWTEWADKHHLNRDKVLHYIHGRLPVETMRLLTPHLDAEREAAEFAASEAGDTNGLIKIPGAPELLQSIPANAWAIATSGTRAIAATRLGFGGLPVPEVLITADDVSKGKPDPEPYLFAAMMLGVKPARCVVIEDAPAGIQAGLAAGTRVVAIISNAYPAEELRHAQVVVRKLSDIEVIQAPKTAQARLMVRMKGI